MLHIMYDHYVSVETLRDEVQRTATQMNLDLDPLQHFTEAITAVQAKCSLANQSLGDNVQQIFLDEIRVHQIMAESRETLLVRKACAHCWC